jgi:penicillin amidase
VPRRRALRLSLLGVAGIVVVVVLVAFVATVVVVRRPFPTQDGSLSLPGLSAPVTVVRDDRGVPQVYASTADDLFRVQGYVQAEDRFFQMDFRRHVTAGRLSELVGQNETALQADKVVRTLGWRRVAQAELEQADPTTRRYLDDYARGVNDYIGNRSPSQLGLDYTVLGLAQPLAHIEPWTALDSVTWFKAMAWDLRGNYDDELGRARVYGSVKDVERVDQLWPVYPASRHAPIMPDAGAGAAGPTSSASPSATPSASPSASPSAGPSAGPSTAAAAPRPARLVRGTRPGELLTALGSAGAQGGLDAAQAALDAVPNLLGGGADGVGSNSWVVSGRLTSTGKPLLANDPHLAPSIPGIWYQMGLHCQTLSQACPFDVAGFTFAGVPGVIIGHTNRIAWGMTNLGPDVTDFYLERVTPQGGYLRDGATVPLQARQETIKVAGGDPVTITVRSTDHGPLLSDVIDAVQAVGRRAPVAKTAPPRGDGYAVALRWTALTPGHDMDAVFAVDTAVDFGSFRTAVQMMDVPAQNFVYADIDGTIGYQAPGRIPQRRGGVPSDPVPGDGTWPMPGWDSRYDWLPQYVPSDRLPWELNPKEGFIVAANQAVTPAGAGPVLTHDFDYGYRSQRIRDLLAAAAGAGHKLQVQDMQSMQLDTRNGIAAELVPVLVKEKIVDPFTQEAVDLLKTWDYTEPTDSAAAAYFNAVWAALLQLTFDDELPPGTQPNGGGRWAEVVRNLLQDASDPWWDNRSTPGVVETRDEILRQALVKARLRLTTDLGKDPSTWQWGELHRLRLVEQPLGGAGLTKLLHPLLNRGPIDAPGGPSIVDAMAYDASSGTFDVTSAPSMRMVVDLSAFDRSTWVNQTGASGHPGQANYDDQLDAWASGEEFPWPFTQPAVDRSAAQRLTITPSASP